MELAAHFGNNVWDEAARGACEGCQENARGAQGPEHLRGSTGRRCHTKLHVAAGSGTVLVKPGLFTAVVGIYSSVSLAASARAKHAVHAKQAGWS